MTRPLIDVDAAYAQTMDMAQTVEIAVTVQRKGEMPVLVAREHSEHNPFAYTQVMGVADAIERNLFNNGYSKVMHTSYPGINKITTWEKETPTDYLTRVDEVIVCVSETYVPRPLRHPSGMDLEGLSWSKWF